MLYCPGVAVGVGPDNTVLLTPTLLTVIIAVPLSPTTGVPSVVCAVTLDDMLL